MGKDIGASGNVVRVEMGPVCKDGVGRELEPVGIWMIWRWGLWDCD